MRRQAIQLEPGLLGDAELLQRILWGCMLTVNKAREGCPTPPHPTPPLHTLPVIFLISFL